MKRIVACVLVFFFSTIGSALAEPKLAKQLTRSMRSFENQLCQSFQSIKCKRAKPAKAAAKRTKTKQSKAVAKPKKIVPAVAKQTSTQQAAAQDQQPATPPKAEEQALPEQKVLLPVLKPKKISEVAETAEADAAPAKPEKKASAPEPAMTTVNKTPPAAKPAKPEIEVASATVRKLTPLPRNALDMEKCLMELQKAGASFAPTTAEDPEQGCSVPNAVRINSVVIAKRTTRFPDQPVLACDYALQLTRWTAENRVLEDGRYITSLWTGPGYQCRGRNGDVTAKLSAHAFGNAVDIERFKLSDGSTVNVVQALKPGSSGFKLLQKLRDSACATFTTVLGPGANTAHESHLHFDLEQRKSGYRICQ
ncbi:MAG: extensin family protein [Proteobacteria bacterium]|nr:extensin family protein [Pseudomonadota bacterium]